MTLVGQSDHDAAAHERHSREGDALTRGLLEGEGDGALKDEEATTTVGGGRAEGGDAASGGGGDDADDADRDEGAVFQAALHVQAAWDGRRSDGLAASSAPLRYARGAFRLHLEVCSRASKRSLGFGRSALGSTDPTRRRAPGRASPRHHLRLNPGAPRRPASLALSRAVGAQVGGDRRAAAPLLLRGS